MVICHCKAVTDRCVDHALREGARTLAQVCRNTGAGQDCGVCVLSVKREMQANTLSVGVSGSA
ncbi:(2Fe-2S)-binding protein [Intrasporangium sp.]|uniref:(2Fe-2S)-binding protein n=1 Tax=Intrasporangium sp. TaxID=1925024 RepID=UPI0039C89F9D